MLAVTARAQQQDLVILHEDLGTIVDAEENLQLYIFDLDVGFKAARAYQLSPNRWVLHLMGEDETGPWLRTRNLRQTTFVSLQRRVEYRLNKREQGHLFSEPVLRIGKDIKGKRDVPQKLTLLDGSTIFVTLTQCSGDTITFKTTTGTQLLVRDKDILSIDRPQETLRHNRFGQQDPNAVRLFFAPTGRTLRKGEGQLSDFYVFFPGAALGITDNFMLAGGISLIPETNQLIYAAPKFNFFHGDKTDLAAGVLFTTVPGSGSFGMAYGSASFGDVTGGVTLGAGIAFESADIEGGLFAGFVGGERQLSANFKLLSEGWLLTNSSDSELIALGGLRFIGAPLTVDFGLATSSSLLDGNDENFIDFLPWLSFSINFGPR